MKGSEIVNIQPNQSLDILLDFVRNHTLASVKNELKYSDQLVENVQNKLMPSYYSADYILT